MFKKCLSNKLYKILRTAIFILSATSFLLISSCATNDSSIISKQDSSVAELSQQHSDNHARSKYYNNYEFDFITKQELSGWFRLNTKSAGVNSQMATFLPKSQTLSNWSQSLVDSRIYGLDEPTLTINGLAQAIIQEVNFNCKQVNTDQKNTQGYDYFLTIVGKGCKEDKQSESEVHVVRVIDQSNVLYVLHYTMISNRSPHDAMSKMFNYIKNAKLKPISSTANTKGI